MGDRRSNILASVLVATVAVIGLTLALQGWRSRVPAFDMVTYFRSAEALLRHGVFPAYGDLSSYGSFSPPGTAWLLAPGMLVFDDPRLYEKLGSGILHVGTLVGIFFLARDTLGRRTGLVAVAVYGLSALGITFAGSLWPIGHPFFYVWIIYFATRWAVTRRPAYLAASVAACAIGMYQDLAIAPVAVVLPLVWLAYRPPVRSSALIAALLVGLLVWFPYLRFEAARGFADARSLVLRENILPADYRAAWCDPGLVLVEAGDPIDGTSDSADGPPPPSDAPPASLLDRVLARLMAVPRGLLASFEEVVTLPGAAAVLFAVVLVTVVDMALRAVRLRRRVREPRRFTSSLDPRRPRQLNHRGIELALLGLAVPWLILIALAEADRPERFFWLWPLHAIWLAAFVTRVLPRRTGRWWVSWVAGAVLLALLSLGPLQWRAASWSDDGWAGSEPEELLVVDYVARDILAAGRSQAAIGYQTFIFDFMPKYHILDPQYKVGAEFDLLFEHSYGIDNRNQCAEGVSQGDDYRIVQRRPRSAPDEPRDAFDVSLDGRFRLLARFDLYDVFRKA